MNLKICEQNDGAVLKSVTGEPSPPPTSHRDPTPCRLCGLDRSLTIGRVCYKCKETMEHIDELITFRRGRIVVTTFIESGMSIYRILDQIEAAEKIEAEQASK